jgi:hypothetical protein
MQKILVIKLPLEKRRRDVAMQRLYGVIILMTLSVKSKFTSQKYDKTDFFAFAFCFYPTVF